MKFTLNGLFTDEIFEPGFLSTETLSSMLINKTSISLSRADFFCCWILRLILVNYVNDDSAFVFFFLLNLMEIFSFCTFDVLPTNLLTFLSSVTAILFLMISEIGSHVTFDNNKIQCQIKSFFISRKHTHAHRISPSRKKSG